MRSVAQPPNRVKRNLAHSMPCVQYNMTHVRMRCTQVRVSFDMSVSGNRFLDIFLSAGLSCHRVHHLLPCAPPRPHALRPCACCWNLRPLRYRECTLGMFARWLRYQRSGFANILSEEAVKAACAKHDVKWERTRSFPRERVPLLASHYLCSPPRGSKSANAGLIGEMFDLSALRLAGELIFFGFLGEGGI